MSIRRKMIGRLQSGFIKEGLRQDFAFCNRYTYFEDPRTRYNVRDSLARVVDWIKWTPEK